MSDAMIAFLPLAGIFVLFGVILVWQRRSRRSQRPMVLVAVGPRSRWSTRPPLMKTPEQLALLKAIGTTIEEAGLGTAKSLLFLRQPTMDLVVEADDPDALAQQLEPLLARFPVAVSRVGRRDDLAWSAKLWRHM